MFTSNFIFSYAFFFFLVPVGSSQPVLRRQSWKGSKESLAPRHGHGRMYRSDSPGPPPAFPQGHPGTSQRVNPPLLPQVRSVTPPPNRGSVPPGSSWDSNPSTKRYSGNMDYSVPRSSPVPQGAWPDGYSAAAPQNQRGISPVPMGHQPIIMQSSGGNKFPFPPSWPQNNSPQPDYMPGGTRQPPPPYPVNQSSRHSPTDQQTGGPTSSPSCVNGGNIPQGHNLDLYSTGSSQSWSQVHLGSNQSQSSSGNSSNQDLSPSWQNNMPIRSNSFNSHQLNSRPAHLDSSQSPSITLTAITQTNIQPAVTSTRVQKPELHTAVAPTHRPWKPQVAPPPAAPAYPEPPTSVPQIVAEVPNYQGPPPPYPKSKYRLPVQAAPCPPAYDTGANKLSAGRDDPAEEESCSGGDSSKEKTSESPEGRAATEKENKQITTSPVPVRRNKKERRGESGRVALYSPQAFKFFMEQHIENILKNHQQRICRRKQLENEMQRVRTSVEETSHQLLLNFSTFLAVFLPFHFAYIMYLFFMQFCFSQLFFLFSSTVTNS